MKPNLLAFAALGLALASAPFLYQKFFAAKPQPVASTPSLDEAKRELQGKDFLVVGGTKGIGRALADDLASLGAKVTVTGRSLEPGQHQLEFVRSDVSTVKNAHRLVTEQLKGRKFDTVVFTVGVLTTQDLQKNEEGIERDLATSYLSRFVIANDLLKANALTGRKRMFVMGFPGVDMRPTDMDDLNFESTKYSAMLAHLNTVVMNEALVFELAERHPDIHVFGLNPGMIQTDIRKNFYGESTIGKTLGSVMETILALLMPSTEEYATKVLRPLMVSSELNLLTGISFEKDGSRCKVQPWMAEAGNRKKAWKVSENLVAKVLG